MASPQDPKIPKNVVDDGKQTIVANILKITARTLDVFLVKRLPEWTKNRRHDKILIICGAHGNLDGTLAEPAEASDLREMKASWIKRNVVREDQVEVLDIFEYLKEKEGLEIDEPKFVAKVIEVKPGIIVICVCHSHLSKIHLILTEAGILSIQKLERDLQLATRGRSIALDETQRKLLFTVAKPENICKTTIIHGTEGSGKTILALEVLKMKLAHYMRKSNLYGIKTKNQKLIKVIVCGSYSGNDRVPALLKQLYEETDDIREFCDFELKPINDLEMTTPVKFQKKIKQTLDLGEKQTIVMMDELFPGFTTAEWKDFEGLEKTDFVLALRHAFNDGVCYGAIQKLFKRQSEYQSVMEQQGVIERNEIIFCHLQESYRCSQQLLDLAYYMLIHSPIEDNLFQKKSFIHLPSKVQGQTPMWLDVPSIKSFIEYSNNDPELQKSKDVLVIFDPDYNGHAIQTLRVHCIGRGWKARPSSEVMGSEASIVIIFDLPKVHFESISRAVNHLVFVTITENQTSLKKVLQEINERRHDKNVCKHNWKQNGKIFNQIPSTCAFYTGSSSYTDLLLHKELKSPGTMVASDSNNEISSPIGKFSYKLAKMEDIKDEIIIGCRIKKDLNEIESDLQTLGWSILQTCIESENVDKFEPYLEKFCELYPDIVKMIRAKYNIVDVLKTAAEKGFSQFFKALVQDLEDPNRKNPADEHQFTPLHLAARYGQLEIVKFLVPQLVNKFPKSGSMKYEGTFREWHGMTPLHEAAVKGHLKVIEYLLTFVADDDINPPQGIGYTVMGIAAYFGHLNVVSYYTEKLEDVNPKDNSRDKFSGSTPLHNASQNGHFSVVQHICNHLQDKNPSDDAGITPFWLAAQQGHLKIVSFYTEVLDNANPKRTFPEKDKQFNGRTPLHIAAQLGQTRIVEHICNLLQDKNPSDDAGVTPLYLAAERGHLKVVSFYTKILDDPNPKRSWPENQKQFEGTTPLHKAAQFGHLSVVKHICNLLQDKNPSDSNGHTPLHLAAEFGHLEIVQHLVQFLDNPHPRNGNYWENKTPLEIAKQEGHTHVVKFLKSLDKSN